MQDNALLLDAATAQSSPLVLDAAARLATVSAADMLTPADRGPTTLFSEASLLGPSKDSHGAEQSSFLCFAPSEKYSDQGALLTSVQMLTNRVLSGQPALNNAVQMGNQLVEGASEIVAQTTTFAKGAAAETVQEISESAHEWLRAAEDAWRAPDNTTRTVLRQRADQLANGVGELIKGIDDSDRMEKVRSYWQKASEAFNNLTNSLYSELGYVEATTADTVDSALDSVLERAEQRLRETLTDLRASDRFEEAVKTAFGQVDTQAAQSVVDSFISGTSVPEITVVEADVLKGGAAFGDNTIFVSANYLTQNSQNPDAIDAVLLEEAGHYFDKALNTTDAAGDEGNIFARLALGEVLAADTLQQLKLEDDRSAIVYNGKHIEIENFWDSISSGFDSFTSAASDYASDTYDSVSDYASDTYDSVSDYASDTYDSVSDYASDTYDSVSDYASDTYDSVSDYASDAYDSVSDYASDTYDAVSDYASDTYDSVSDYASDTYDSVSDYASDTYDAVSDSVSDTYDAVSDSVSDTYDAVSDYASDTYDAVSDYASDTYDSVSDYASDTYDSVSDYASDTYDSVSDYASDTYDAVSDYASDTYDAVSDSVSDTYDAVSDYASDTYDAAVDTLDTVTETITDTVVDAYDSGVEMATEAVDDLATFASDSYDTVTDGLSNAWDAAVETVDDVGETLVDAKDATVEFVTEDAPEWIAETAIDVKDATVEFVTEDVPEWIAENETTVNRVVGGVQAVGGVGEMVVGAALVPTGAASFGAGTVAGGVVMAHGADTTWAGLKALWTGESQETYTQQGVTAIADAIPGVETDTAESIGMWTDIGLGIAGPLGAARAVANSADNIATGVADNVVTSVTDDVVTSTTDDVATSVTDDVVTSVADSAATNMTDDVVTGATDDVVTGATDDAVANAVDDVADAAADTGSTTFFHGTASDVATDIRTQGIDLAKGSPYSDFGQGFYMTTSREEALSSASRLYGDDALDVVRFDIPNTELDNLSGLNFPTAADDWQDFVRFHKTYGPDDLLHGGTSYDVVSGPLFSRYTNGRAGALSWGDRVPQTSIHTQDAVDVFNRGIVTE